MSNIESGKSNPKGETVAKIVKALNTNVDFIHGRTMNSSPEDQLPDGRMPANIDDIACRMDLMQDSLNRIAAAMEKIAKVVSHGTNEA